MLVIWDVVSLSLISLNISLGVKWIRISIDIITELDHWNSIYSVSFLPTGLWQYSARLVAWLVTPEYIKLWMIRPIQLKMSNLKTREEKPKMHFNFSVLTFRWFLCLAPISSYRNGKPTVSRQIYSQSVSASCSAPSCRAFFSGL